jgi:signal transduction histidine kinase
MYNRKRSEELIIVHRKLAFQNKEREKRAAELMVANIERDFQNVEKEKRAAELDIANIELAFQNEEKEKRAAELVLANLELVYQNQEKDKRAAELMIANKELIFQNEEKEKRAAELDIANIELAFQNEEKEKRAAELVLANLELAYQNQEKDKRAAELMIANKELIFQNEEKGKRAAELIITNEELAFQTQAKEINKKKDEFIGLASHELKTPLTSINAYLQFLQRNLAHDEKNRELTDKALQQVGKLHSLISDLLDVSKIESGKLPLLFQTFDLVDLLKEVVEMMQYGNLTHKIKTNYKLKELSVYADKQRIEQVIINLISNAIKYSPNADRIVISLSQTDKNVVVSIQDFGIGIKQDQQSRIFSRFYRVEELAPFIPGLGIGLYISEDIISRHNGTLCVESKLGIGSTFSFKIPKNQQVD